MNSFWGRVFWASLFLLVDGLFFLLPLGAFFIAYVLLARPRWVKERIDRLYA